MLHVDYQTRQINVGIAVIGTQSIAVMRTIHHKTSAPAGGAVPAPVVDAQPGMPVFHYFALRMGQMGAFSSTIHLYGFEADARLIPIIEYSLPNIGGIDAVFPALKAIGREVLNQLKQG